jgi:hypothetical protein
MKEDREERQIAIERQRYRYLEGLREMDALPGSCKNAPATAVLATPR